MDASPIVFRCDAGPRIGVGHVMRCVALAEELADRGHPIVFVADLKDVPWAHRQVTSRGFSVLAPPADTGDEAEALLRLGANWVVIDSYLLPGSVHAAVVEAGARLLTFVDGDPTDRTGTLLLDQNIGAERDVWPLPAGARRLAGLDYALMRAEVLESRPTAPRSHDADPPRVFAFFGGTDAFGAGPLLTRALIETGLPFELRVVATAEWADRPEPGPGQSVTVIAPTDRLAEEVTAADLVISAAGSSSWELLCLGAACAFVCVAPNQESAYLRAIDGGLGIGVGHLDAVRSDRATATAALAGVLGSAPRRAELRATGWTRVDGRGRTRVADAMAQRVHT